MQVHTPQQTKAHVLKIFEILELEDKSNFGNVSRHSNTFIKSK